MRFGSPLNPLFFVVCCALVSLPSAAAEDPPPPDANNSEEPEPEEADSDGSHEHEGEPCNTNDDCPEGYYCGSHGGPSIVDGSDNPGSEDDMDSEYNGICLWDYSCDTNDDCDDGEFCDMEERLECVHQDNDEWACSSVQDGWCADDDRVDCTEASDCHLEEVCHERSIDDHAHCTFGRKVPCTEDSQCGDRLVCEEILLDRFCYGTAVSSNSNPDAEPGTFECEDLAAERCVMRTCTHSDICLDDEICVRIHAEHHHPLDHEPSPESEDDPMPPEGDEWWLPEEGVCAPPAAGDCDNDDECGEYEECAEMGNLPCFDDDTQCEEATVSICADIRMECEEDTDCPGSYHCSFQYTTMGPFDYGPYMGGPDSGGGPIEVDAPEEDSDETDDSEDDGEPQEPPNPDPEDGHDEEIEQDVGLCFPEYGDLMFCDDEAECLRYVDWSYSGWSDHDEDDALPQDQEDGPGNGPGTGGDDDDDNGNGDDGDVGPVDGDDGDDGDEDPAGDNNGGEDDTNLNVNEAPEPGSEGSQPLFSCHSTGGEGLVSLLGLVTLMGLRRRRVITFDIN